MSVPILKIFNPDDTIHILTSTSGWKMSPPYWLPKIADLKGGGTFVSSTFVEGRELSFGKKGNVIESIPLVLQGIDQNAAINTLRRLLKVFEDIPIHSDDTWIQVKPFIQGSRSGYARIIKATVPQIGDPYGQPFFTSFDGVAMHGVTLIVEREPVWRLMAPGEILGPLINHCKNSSFELWSAGTETSIPDSWSDTFLAGVSSHRNDESRGYSLKLSVNTTTLGRSYLLQAQTLRNNTTHTLVARVRSEGIVGGYGEISIGDSPTSSKVVIYQSNERHSYETFYGIFTTGVSDSLNIYINIVVESSPSSGTIYFDDLMLLEGDWEDELAQELLPFMTSSSVANHSDQARSAIVDAGDVNYVDVWNVPGDVDALVRLEVQNDTTPTDLDSPQEVIARLRIGQRREGVVENFDNLHDPPGVSDANATSGDRIESGILTTVWQTVTTKIIQNNVSDNLGRFRVYARIQDPKVSGEPSIEARIRYFLGVAGVGEKTLRGTALLLRGDWAMLDTTAIEAATLEAKHSTETPSQLGYFLQVRRTDSDTTGIYLDYVLTMPTDGGWLDAKIDPPLTQGNSLIADSTGVRQGIRASYRAGGQRILFRPSPVPVSLKEFQTALYIGCESGKLYSLINGVGTEKSDYGSSDVKALEVFNETLYIAHSTDVMTSDGDTFPLAAVFTLPNTVAVMRSFNGLLWSGVEGSSGPIYTWNNSTSTLKYTTNETDVTSLEVFGNKLYAGTSNAAKVFVYDPGTDLFTTSLTLTASQADAVTSLQSFNGRIFAGTSPNGKVFAFGGDAWTEVVDFGIINTINTMGVLGNRMYAAGSPAAPIMATIDGDTWERIYDEETQEINDLVAFEGILYLAEVTQKNIITIPFGDVEYKVPDHEGTAFTSPRSRRHRWVFSFDRRDFRNDIDDRVLAGIGFVPRYLSLIGKGT